MPNWVVNKVTFDGKKKDIDALRKFVTTEENAFDFQKIYPMPESLNVTSGSDETFAIRCAKSYMTGSHGPTKEYVESTWQKERKTFKEWVDLGMVYIHNMEEYGAYDWYDWRWKHWGTKWNSSDATWCGDNMVEFDTAWSAPEEIYRRLGVLFPDVEINVDYADEDLGNNCGTIWVLGEDMSVEPVETFEFACEVHGYDPDEIKREWGMEEEEDGTAVSNSN